MSSTEHPSAERASERLAYLDGLRAIAALGVFATHTYQQIYRWKNPQPEGVIKLLAPFLMLGQIFVVLFIVLSGFVLMRPVVLSGGFRQGVRAYLIARCKRILPAYYAAMCLTLLLILTLIGTPRGGVFDLSLSPTLKSTAAHFLMIHNLYPPPFFSFAGNTSICSVYWTIALEFQIYLLFPSLVWIWQRRGIGVMLACTGVGACAVYVLTHKLPITSIDWVGINANFYLYFALGATASALSVSPSYRNLRDRFAWQLLWLPMLLLLLALQALRERLSLGEPILDTLAAFGFSALLVSCAAGHRITRFLSHPLPVRIGLFSYSFYLLHLPILALFTDYVMLPFCLHLPRLTQLVLLSALALPTALGAAYAFSLVFENKRRINSGIAFVSHLLLRRKES